MAEGIGDNTLNQQLLGFGQGVSGGPGISQNFTRGEDKSTSKTVTFSRTYIHFLGPGTEYMGAQIKSNDDNQMCFAFDFGGNILPYTYSRASCRPRHLLSYLMKCNSYRMLGHKAVCTDLICSRDEIQADGRVVSTPQQDSIEIFSDTQGKFRPNNVSPIGSKTLFEINNDFRTVEPESYNDGLLPRAEIVLPPEQYNSTWNEKMSDFKLRMFDVYNGMFTVSHWHTGENFEVSHSFDSGRIPVGTFHNITKLACNKNKLVLCNKLLDTVWGVQANMATQSNRYPIQPAPITFMRFAPFLLLLARHKEELNLNALIVQQWNFISLPMSV